MGPVRECIIHHGPFRGAFWLHWEGRATGYVMLDEEMEGKRCTRDDSCSLSQDSGGRGD